MNLEKKKLKPIKLFYDINKTYSITICPNDANQGIEKRPCNIASEHTERLIRVQNKLFEYLIAYNRDLRYIIHTDISEPRNIKNNLPRIHFHGVIRFDEYENILKWLLKILPELSTFGIIDIDTIDNIEHWEKYCKKYDHITRQRPLKNKMEWRIKS